MTQNNPSSSGKPIPRQITLPLSKAIEIAWKNIRMRMSRSLVVTSSIVLALSFLMFILCGDVIVDGMRTWMRTFPTSPQFVALEKQQNDIQVQIQAVTAKLSQAAGLMPASAGKPPFDAKAALGDDFAGLQRRLGAMPLPPDDLAMLLSARGDLLDAMKNWMTLTQQSRAIKNQLNGPQQLASLMKLNGVPIASREIKASKVQTRWLGGVALLVAFAGILNAMLMSVTERYREIGTMKCLGALDSFIVKLFVIESSFQGAAGTLAGVLLGFLLSMLGASSTYGQFAWRMFPVAEVLTLGGICVVVGIILTVAGAVYPAWQAARMHPIEAMRADM